MRRLLPLCLLVLAACSSAPRVPYTDAAAKAAFTSESMNVVAVAEDGDSHGIGHRLLWWIPNRLFDVFDVVRARARLGPGFGAGIRLTQIVGAGAGWYSAVWLGLPGPRLTPEVPLPIGTESMVKAYVTFLGKDIGVGTHSGVTYGYAEIGAQAQFVILGADVGIDLWEVVDFALGIITLDPVGDDF